MSAWQPISFSLEELKRCAVKLGYRFEVDADGTERMIRPDGSVAVIARRRLPAAPHPPTRDEA